MVSYFPIVTGSLTVLGNINVSGSITTSGSITISGSITSASFATSASNATNAISASYANNLTVAGTLTAQTLVVQTITSSVLYSSGSNVFGNNIANTQTFTGSINASGSGNFSGSITSLGTITSVGSSPVFRNTDNSVGNVFDVLWSVGGSYWAYGVAGFYDATNSQKYDEYKGGASGFRKLYTNGTLALTIESTGATTINATTAVALTANGGNASDGTVAKFARGGSEKNFYVSATNNQYINLGTEGDFKFKVGCTVDQPYATGTTALFISASGNIGINYSNPDAFVASSGFGNLVVGNGSGETGITIFSGTAGSSGLMFADATSGNGAYTGYIVYRHATDKMEIATGGGTPRLTILSTGNVGIGTSSPGRLLEVNGDTTLQGNNYINTAKMIQWEGGSYWSFRVISSAATFQLYQGSTGATPIGVTSGGIILLGGASSTGAYDCSLGSATANTYYQVRSTNTNSLYGADTRGTWIGNLSSKETYVNGGHLVPATDNANYCGSSSYRWAAVFATNGAIQTSDQRLKTNIQTSDLGLDFITQLNPVSYKWIVGGNTAEYSSVEDENGKLNPHVISTPVAGVRTHYGLIAQQVKEVLGDKDFGGFVHDTEIDTMSLRYDQFISPLIKAIQELNTKFEEYKATHP